MDNALHTLIGIALLVFVVLPPVVGGLRERGIDRRLREAERGRARPGTVRRRAVPGPAAVKDARTAPVCPQSTPRCTAEA
ncbi:hypothetical protein ACFPA8_01090 [Streptomyces ovatisporus]|uniref:Secreted protein n=1 Tax=Streptomyces ovatisporus TaxID=1128682 RepID=A0ABV9A552_9ACTN